jgi:hypothetical protein
MAAARYGGRYASTTRGCRLLAPPRGRGVLSSTVCFISSPLLVPECRNAEDRGGRRPGPCFRNGRERERKRKRRRARWSAGAPPGCPASPVPASDTALEQTLVDRQCTGRGVRHANVTFVPAGAFHLQLGSVDLPEVLKWRWRPFAVASRTGGDRCRPRLTGNPRCSGAYDQTSLMRATRVPRSARAQRVEGRATPGHRQPAGGAGPRRRTPPVEPSSNSSRRRCANPSVPRVHPAIPFPSSEHSEATG